MKNRKREICTSGSVRDEDGQPPHLLGRRQFLHLAAGAVALPSVSCFAWAQAYPTRPVRLIVGFAAGGTTDITARLIGQWLSERLGQQFLIENRTGAATNIATETGAMLVRHAQSGVAEWLRLIPPRSPLLSCSGRASYRSVIIAHNGQSVAKQAECMLGPRVAWPLIETRLSCGASSSGRAASGGVEASSG
jgi:hypothetical protein